MNADELERCSECGAVATWTEMHELGVDWYVCDECVIDDSDDAYERQRAWMDGAL